jgi:outer membrane lipopolysaccharide assembly protein LptE/RlpB
VFYVNIFLEDLAFAFAFAASVAWLAGCGFGFGSKQQLEDWLVKDSNTWWL